MKYKGGEYLTLKRGKVIYKIRINKLIANMSVGELYLAEDSFKIKYIFNVYEGLLGPIYSLGKYDDGLYGTSVCELKVGFKDVIKRLFK